MRKYMLLVVVVTAVTGTAHAQKPTPAEIERELLKNRIFAAMREVDREGYDFAVGLLTGPGTTDPRGVLTPVAQHVLQSRIFEWILRGTDAAVVNYHRALIARLDVVGRISASECHNLATGLPISPETLGVPAVAKADAAGADYLIALLESTRGRARIDPNERVTASDAERLVSLWTAVAPNPRGYRHL